MSIQRRPHYVFAAYWTLWWFATLYVFLTGDYWTWWLIAFVIPEGIAALWDTGKRDTLSEVMTWFQRKVSKHTRFATGWNAFVLLLVDLLAFAAVRPLWSEYEQLVFLAQLPVFGLLLIRWLYEHWTAPEVHG